MSSNQLQTTRRIRPKLPRIVSLFAGAGGLDLGFKAAGFRVSIAMDSSQAAIDTHQKNFRRTRGLVADLASTAPKAVAAQVLRTIPAGSRIGVIGGPPCQGFSRANVNSRNDDPRNSLALVYLAIIRELQKLYTVEFVVFENVLGIRDKKHAKTFSALKSDLSSLGLVVAEHEFCAVDFGVPQNRRRVVLMGLREAAAYGIVKPRRRRGIRTVREAIEGLAPPVFFKRGLKPEDFPDHPNHWTMSPKSERFKKPSEIDSEGRSFKKLRWDEPSPTIAFGHREIHVHPTGTRRLSILEAMLLQGFPTEFVLAGNLSEQVTQISNAVPPPLARSIAQAIRRAISDERRQNRPN